MTLKHFDFSSGAANYVDYIYTLPNRSTGSPVGQRIRITEFGNTKGYKFQVALEVESSMYLGQWACLDAERKHCRTRAEAVRIAQTLVDERGL